MVQTSIQLGQALWAFEVYGYRAYNYYEKGSSLYFTRLIPICPRRKIFWSLLRPDSTHTLCDARLLTCAWCFTRSTAAATTSTFTTHVVTSSGTDTYSCHGGGAGVLKGPRHGGANIKVIQMMADLEEKVADWEDEEEVRRYLEGLLNREQFDRKGPIYGMGHAVYSLSGSSCRPVEPVCGKPSAEKGWKRSFSPTNGWSGWSRSVSPASAIFGGVCANVDLYSGFVYRMLDLPVELYTPIFVVARGVAGLPIDRRADQHGQDHPPGLQGGVPREGIPGAERAVKIRRRCLRSDLISGFF